MTIKPSATRKNEVLVPLNQLKKMNVLRRAFLDVRRGARFRYYRGIQKHDVEVLLIRAFSLIRHSDCYKGHFVKSRKSSSLRVGPDA
jgi:transcription termination factor Rho